MTKTPLEVANDVIDGYVEDHDTKWWRGRAFTLAYEVQRLNEALPAGSIENPLPTFNEPTAIITKRRFGYSIRGCELWSRAQKVYWRPTMRTAQRVAYKRFGVSS